MENVHVAILGAGPGGYYAALRARQLGARVTLIESGAIGGVCMNWGCVPTKALLRSAEVLEMVRRAGEFGVQTPGAELDWPAVVARKDNIVQQLVGNVTMLLNRAGVEIIHGKGTFTGPWSIAVRGEGESQELRPDRIIIATGSTPIVLPIPGLDLPQVLNSDQVLSLPAIPKRMLVIGGGAIGVEFASLLRSAGAEVTLVEVLPRLVPNADHDLGEGLAWSFGERGIKVMTGARVARVEPAGSGDAVVCHVQDQAGTQQIEVDRVLVAVGRRPNVDGYGLDTAGIRYSPKGIATNECMETNVAGVFAIGDCAGGALLAHKAMREGIVAAENAAGESSFMDYRAVPACIFSEPEVATVGMSEEQAREAGYTVRVGKFAFVNNGKALATGETDGFVKIVSDDQIGQILGVHIIGPHANDLILEGTLSINLEATLEEIDKTIHPHPTLGESIVEAALASYGRAIHIPVKRSAAKA